MSKSSEKTESEELTELDSVLEDYYSKEHSDDEPEAEYETEQGDEEISNAFLSSGSNVQGIARLNFIPSLVIGGILIVLGVGQSEESGVTAALLICLGLIVIAVGLSSYYKLKAFGEMAETVKVCAYYLEKLSGQLDELSKKSGK